MGQRDRFATNRNTRFPPIFIDPVIEEEKFKVDGENLYTYVNVKAPGSLTWTVGLSYETVNDTQSDYSKKRINPKLGLQWDISNKWRFRTAFVRNIKRLLAMTRRLNPPRWPGSINF